MNKSKLKDIIEWDIVNWSKALPFWEKHVDLSTKKLNCLELGGRRGGLSLWLGLKGHEVICSDLNSPESEAKPKHDRYKLSNIKYLSIDASNISYENEFDIITFKSILGGVCQKRNNISGEDVIKEIHQALKPGGHLIFAENLNSSFLHKFLREKYTKWGAEWNYFSYDEIENLLHPFSEVQLITVGFFSAFGRTEKQRSFLSKLDSSLNWLIPKKKRYIVIGIAKK